MYKKIVLLPILLFFFTGCINYTELNELGIIETMGIEKVNDTFLVTLNMIDAKKNEDDEEEMRKFYEATGSTISEAIDNIYLKSSKKIYLSHLEVLLLSQDVLEDDLSLTIDFFLKNDEARGSFLTVMVKDCSPKEILSDTTHTSSIQDLISINEEEYGITSFITFEDFARRMLEDGYDPLLPVIKLDQGMIEADGYAYFKDQTKISFLTKEESRIYNILENKGKNLTFSFSNHDIVVRSEYINTKKKVKKDHFTYEIDGNIMLISNRLDKRQQEVLEQCEDYLTQQIVLLLEKAKTEKTNFLGFSSFIRKENPSYYQTIKKDLFSLITFDVEVHLHLIFNSNQKGEEA